MIEQKQKKKLYWMNNQYYDKLKLNKINECKRILQNKSY